MFYCRKEQRKNLEKQLYQNKPSTALTSKRADSAASKSIPIREFETENTPFTQINERQIGFQKSR